MKKNQLFLLGFALFSIFLLSNCKRSDDTTPISNHQTDIYKASSIDSIDVSISQQTDIDHYLCDTLGVGDFSINSGTYYLVFDQNNPYGKVTFSIQNGTNIINSPGVGVKIKVARINAPKCQTCTCCCGIGFRCGFVKWDPPTPDYTPIDADRYLDATIQIINGNLVIRMDEEIPIGDTGWEI